MENTTQGIVPRPDRTLELAYIAKINAAVADDRTDLAHELSAELLVQRAQCA
jgi:hypothetical protein